MENKMLQVIVTGLFLYLCITWVLRSLTINRRYRDLYVVITGCDSGFGKELAYRLDRFALWGIVNNAGISGALAFSDILTRNIWIEIFDVNLFGMAEMTKQVRPLLRKSKGRYSNTSSVAGRLGSGFLPYPVSKFAVEGYSDCLEVKLTKCLLV
ncbi:hypothetical protein KUTeg_008432 [Tegillarca granosa]|uniref:Uncharacterized protein n=1 Tax=Tegillarca granosa TaxID=220873 RepID=A0ABQ9FCC8_TEGGR|nr:hypothetical protein KUTeg_008432 [Tegillarca granosa]